MMMQSERKRGAKYECNKEKEEEQEEEEGDDDDAK